MRRLEPFVGLRYYDSLRFSFFPAQILTFLRCEINGFGGVLVLFFQNFFPVLSHQYLQNTQMTCVGGRGRDRVYGTQATDERLAEPLLLSISNTVVISVVCKYPQETKNMNVMKRFNWQK